MRIYQLVNKYWRKVILTFIGLTITIILLIFLLSYVSIKQIFELFMNISPISLVFAFFFYFLSYIFRASRFHTLVNKRISYIEMFSIVGMHNFVNHLLPFRLGEFSLLYLLKKNHIDLPNSTSILVFVRLLDFFFVLIFFTTFLFFIPSFAFSILFYGALFTLLLILISFIFFLETYSKIFYKIIGPIISKSRYLIKISHFFKEFVYVFENLLHKKNYLNILINTLLIWICQYSSMIFLLKGVSKELSVYIILFGATFVLVSSALPIQSFMGFGTNETAWTIALLLLGKTKELAISSGFIQHITILIFVISIGLISIIINQVTSTKKNRAS